MSSKNELKILIMKEALTVQKLADMLSQKPVKLTPNEVCKTKYF